MENIKFSLLQAASEIMLCEAIPANWLTLSIGDKYEFIDDHIRDEHRTKAASKIIKQMNAWALFLSNVVERERADSTPLVDYTEPLVIHDITFKYCAIVEGQEIYHIPRDKWEAVRPHYQDDVQALENFKGYRVVNRLEVKEVKESIYWESN